MMLTLRRSEDFAVDFDRQYRWYLHEAGEAVAERYYASVITTLNELLRQPGLGRERKFRHLDLSGLRSFRIQPPFNVHLIFYRYTESELTAERIMHGARDLSRRLRERP
ncbi:MAG: type II toxin-antitoxin system RelE/ParE family toxin [Verrucomicrobiota bacterium]